MANNSARTRENLSIICWESIDNPRAAREMTERAWSVPTRDETHEGFRCSPARSLRRESGLRRQSVENLLDGAVSQGAHLVVGAVLDGGRHPHPAGRHAQGMGPGPCGLG